MTATARDLHAQANRRIDDAVTEGLDQLAKGWRPREVLVVLKDAAHIVADLWEQSRIAEGREITASLQASNDHYNRYPRVEATS